MSDHNDAIKPDRPDRKTKGMLGIHWDKSVIRVVKEEALRDGITLDAFMSRAVARELSTRGRAVPEELQRDLKDYEKYGRRRRRSESAGS